MRFDLNGDDERIDLAILTGRIAATAILKSDIEGRRDVLVELTL